MENLSLIESFSEFKTKSLLTELRLCQFWKCLETH